MEHPTAIALGGARASDNGGELEASRGSDSNPDITTTAEELRPIDRKRQTLVLISGFLTICITIGFNQSYGVFQNYYISSTQTELPKSTANDSAMVAFVGTLGAGLTWGGSIFVNPTMARLGVGGTRGLGVLGVFFMSLGFMLASFSTQVRQIPAFHGLMAHMLLFRSGISYSLKAFCTASDHLYYTSLS